MNHCLFLGLGVFQAMSCKQMPDNMMSVLRDLHTVLCPMSLLNVHGNPTFGLHCFLHYQFFVLTPIAIAASG